MATVEENIYNAYKTGLMTPEESNEYIADINSGKIQLPTGVTLEVPKISETVKTKAPILDSGIFYAYQSGQMSEDERKQLEADVEAGKWSLPENLQLVPEIQTKIEQLGFWGKLGEQITGKVRKTAETEGLPDIGYLPELNEISTKGFKTGLGHLTANNEEFLQILKANYPDIEVRQDKSGNAIIKSSIDNKEYALKPGFKMSDVPRALWLILAFTPAGRAETTAGQVLGAATTQAGIETAQAMIGGEFDPKEIAMAGAGAGVGHVVSKGVSAGAKKLFPKTLKEAAEEGVELTDEALEQIPIPDQISTKEMSVLVKKASEGSKKAQEALAKQALPNKEIVESAENLGILDYLQPDHVTTNQAYREAAQAIKSIPGSKAKIMEMEAIEATAKRADDLIEEIGGTTNLSDLDVSVRTRMKDIQNQLYEEAESLYGLLREQISGNTSINPIETVGFIESRLKTRKGLIQNLSKEERMILKKLKPDGTDFPTYDILDDVRKDLVRARIKKTGPFKDADSGLIKKLEDQLLKDQERVVSNVGDLNSKDVFKFARQSTAIRKGLEDDMKAIFGRTLEGSLTKNLADSIKALERGDVMKLSKLIRSVPEEMRGEVMASGLNTAFKKSATKLNLKAFVDWYEALGKNNHARVLVYSNLPAYAKKSLRDLYNVSKGITKTAAEQAKGKRLKVIYSELNEADNLIGKVYDVAKKSVPGAIAEIPASMLGVRGAGIAAGVTSALSRSKPNILRAADELITSLEFIELAGKGSEEAAKKLAKSSAWRKFYNELGKPKELSNPEQWLLKSWQALRQTEEE